VSKVEKHVADRFVELLRPIERELEVYCRRMVWESGDAPDAIFHNVYTHDPEKLRA
jgi:hypothetical protein